MSKLLDFMELSCRYYDLKQMELEITQKLSGDLTGKKVLEIGCGIGRLSFQLAPLVGEIISTDINEEFISYCTRKLAEFQFKERIKFEVVDGRNLPYSSESFDVIIYPWILSTVDLENDLEKMLKEGHRVLKENGKMVTIDGAPGSEYGRIIAKFLRPGYLKAIDYLKELRNALVLIFGNIQSYLSLRIPYIFPDLTTAYNVIRYELEDWRKIELDIGAKERLKKEVQAFLNPNNGIVTVHESVAFHVCKKVRL